VSNDLGRGMLNNERYVLIKWLCVLAATALLTGSTLTQIPEGLMPTESLTTGVCRENKHGA
jgi:hypothetical protein